jgi:hypothetical protein
MKKQELYTHRANYYSLTNQRSKNLRLGKQYSCSLEGLTLTKIDSKLRVRLYFDPIYICITPKHYIDFTKRVQKGD